MRVCRKIYVLVFSIGMILTLVSCGREPDQNDLLRKEVVRKVDLRDVISQSGEVQPIIKVELKSEASGKIDNVYVKEGVPLNGPKQVKEPY